jgi:hypothetical protein
MRKLKRRSSYVRGEGRNFSQPTELRKKNLREV